MEKMTDKAKRGWLLATIVLFALSAGVLFATRAWVFGCMSTLLLLTASAPLLTSRAKDHRS